MTIHSNWVIKYMELAHQMLAKSGQIFDGGVGGCREVFGVWVWVWVWVCESSGQQFVWK